MRKFIRMTAVVSILAGSLSLMALQCEKKSDTSKNTATALMSVLSGTHCERVGGFCNDLYNSCGESHVGWVGWGCPDLPDEPDSAVCCLPVTSCAAIGGVCRLKTESCPGKTGGTVFMDCPQGADGQCCIPFE